MLISSAYEHVHFLRLPDMTHKWLSGIFCDMMLLIFHRITPIALIVVLRIHRNSKHVLRVVKGKTYISRRVVA
jgi:hypothetical protein